MSISEYIAHSRLAAGSFSHSASLCATYSRCITEEIMTNCRIAVKRLLRQHLSHDDEAIDVHPLAELILSEGIRMGAGSSIKTDGEDSDPWALVAVLDLARNKVSLVGA